MTQQEIQTKADELSIRENCKVHPLVFKAEGEEEQIVGFIKEPPRFVKLRVMDKAMNAPMTSAAEVVDGYLLKEDSDSKIYDEKPDNDKYYLGAVWEAYNLISMSINQFKKK